MAQKIKQQYGIKYPFTTNLDNGQFIDVNLSLKSKIRSLVMHIVFTPKGQKIRDPEFGTDLIQSIFEPNEQQTWNKIKNAISKALAKYLPSVSLNNIEMLKNEDEPHEIFVKIQYSIKTESGVQTDSVVTSL